MNNESQLENSDFSDGYLLVDDNPRQNKTDRAADLYYNEKRNPPLIIEDLAETPQSGHFKKDAMPTLTPEELPAIESIDGIETTVQDTFIETEERTAQAAELTGKYNHRKSSDELYKDKVYVDDLRRREHGEKIARVIGIDLIIISLAAIVYSFFKGDGMEFVVQLIKIAFTVLFMMGYKVARWFMIFTVTISIYGPFVLLFVSEQAKSPAEIIIYPVVLLMYVFIDALLIFTKDIKEFSTKTFL